MELVTQADIARHFGVSREAVSKWAKGRKHNGFPRAVGVGVYDLDAVIDWRESQLAKRAVAA